MAGSADTAAKPNRMRRKDYDSISSDFTDLSGPQTEISPLTVPPRRRKYFELAYSESSEKSTYTKTVGIQQDFSDISPSASVASFKPVINLPSSTTSTPTATPNSTPQPSPRQSPKLARAADKLPGTTLADDPCQDSLARTEASKKWFGLGSLFESGSRCVPPTQKPVRYLPNREIKKQVEEKLKLYPLPQEPQFFHQKEDSIFMQTIPKQLQTLPRKPKKKHTVDKDINILAPNTF